MKDNLSIQTPLNDLAQEAAELFKAMDNVSELIRSTESHLQRLKIRVPFKQQVEVEAESNSIDIKELTEQDNYLLKENRDYVECFTDQRSWWLVWELDKSSKEKNYRLVLCTKVCHVVYGWRSGDELRIKLEGKLEVIKPLIETDFQTRFRFAHKIPPFIMAFKDCLRNKRISIENSTLPDFSETEKDLMDQIDAIKAKNLIEKTENKVETIESDASSLQE